MCRPTTCRTCGRTTWAGCGQHVAQVKATVPAERWCDGSHPAGQGAAHRPGGFLRRVLGR